MEPLNTYRAGPDEDGRFGLFGGRFVAETLMPLLLELEGAYAEANDDAAFTAELDSHLTQYAGRPSPLTFAQRLSEHLTAEQPELPFDLVFTAKQILFDPFQPQNLQQALGSLLLFDSRRHPIDCMGDLT